MIFVQGIRARVHFGLEIDAMVFIYNAFHFLPHIKNYKQRLIEAILYRQLPRIAFMCEQYAMSDHFTNDLPCELRLKYPPRYDGILIPIIT